MNVFQLHHDCPTQMDPLAQLNTHFLSCNICTDIFKDPCTIGCYHTFCRKCLTKYTKTRRDAITAKSIRCPNCNQMTKVPRPQEPVGQWCDQFKPSFLIQGLLDTFASQRSPDSVEHRCFTCQEIGTTTEAKSVCEDCDILFCEACAKLHVATPVVADHMISQLGAGPNPKLKKRKFMCTEHKCLVEYCCRDCQKAACHKCVIVYHRNCKSVVTLDEMMPEMKQVLQKNFDEIAVHSQQTADNLKNRRSDVEALTQHKSSQESEIRNVSQRAMDVIRRKEKKLLDELDTNTEKQTGELRVEIKSGEIHLQTYQQYSEFIKQVLQSDSLMDLYDMYTLCQSGEITAEVQRHDKRDDRTKKAGFVNQLDVDKIDRTVRLGYFECTPKLLSTVSAILKDWVSHLNDVEVLTIGGTETLVVTDDCNMNIKSLYTINDIPHCTSLQLNDHPSTLTKISPDSVAVSKGTNTIDLIKLTPDPVLVSTIKTKESYTCLAALSDTTLAAAGGIAHRPYTHVLDLSGTVLRSVFRYEACLLRDQRHMCTTRQGHILVVDKDLDNVYCVTQQGEVLYKHKLTEGALAMGGVTTTDSGSVIVADYKGSKIVQLTETGEYVRDLLTRKDGICTPQGIHVHGNRLYVTELNSGHVKIFQL